MLRQLGDALDHVRADGIGLAFAFLWRELAARSRGRDAGERCAERFLRATGHRVLARGWRSARDARDEADLITAVPGGREVAIVEVKRSAGPWDALARVDRRKRAVLWRISEDLCRLASTDRGAARRCDRPLVRALARADLVRVDLIAVRGDHGACHVCETCVGVFERRLGGPRRSGSPRPPPAPG